MASLVTSDKLSSTLKVASYDHDPGATTAIITSPDGGTTKRVQDMRDFAHFMVMAKPTIVAAGCLTKLEIVAATDSAITTAVVVKDSGTVAADALNDYVMLECTVDELAHLGENLRYLAARLTMATSTDEACVTYIAGAARYPGAGLTATNIT